MRTRRWQAELALASVAMVWGSTFVLVKSALEDISTVFFLTLRFSIAAAALGFLLLLRPGRPALQRGAWTGGIVTGCLLYAGYVLQTLGLRYTAASKSGFITGLYIVLVPLFSAVVYRRAPTVSEWLGVTTAMIGLGLLTLDTARFEMALGDLLTLGCAFAFAGHILLLGHYSRRMPSASLAWMQIATCAVFGAATYWWVEPIFVRWSTGVWIALGVTSLLATAFAFLLQTWAQRHTTVTRTAIIFALEPVFAWVTAFLVADEILTAKAMAGAGFILGGILLVELKPLESGSGQRS
jgi:drug/metabolite transporter (DMT)-like permease